jgi:hypothetical protein
MWLSPDGKSAADKSLNLRRVTSLRNLEELPQKRKGSFITVYKKCDETDASNYLGYHLYQLEHSKFYPTSLCQVWFCM